MHPLWLIMDTSGPRAMVALARQGNILAETYLEEYKKHGERLGDATRNCLNQAGLKMSDIDVVATGVGPGSFTGIRIAMAHAKGLCMALQIPLIGFKTPEILNAETVWPLLPENILDETFTLVPHYVRDEQC